MATTCMRCKAGTAWPNVPAHRVWVTLSTTTAGATASSVFFHASLAT